MSKHPLNLALRFILEMTLLFAVAYWGWKEHQGWLRYVLGIGMPVLFTLLWGVFAVPGDPSRSGKTVIKTPGWIRLILELAFFGVGGWAFYQSGMHTVSYVFILLVCGHYLLSTDRIRWLLKK